MKERSLLRRFRWVLFAVVLFGGQLAGTAYLYKDKEAAMVGLVIFLFGCVATVVMAQIDKSNDKTADSN